MRETFRHLWIDEHAFVVSSELILIGCTLAIGMLVGMVSLRDQVVQELADTGGAVAKWAQSYSMAAVTGHSASTGGSVFADTRDFCDYGSPIVCDVDPVTSAATCISLAVDASGES